MSSNEAVLKEKEQHARHLEDKEQELQKEVRLHLTGMHSTVKFFLVLF